MSGGTRDNAQRTTPGPRDRVALEEQGDPLTFLADLIDTYGDVVRYETAYGPCFLFVHPDHVHAILHDENYRRATLVKMMLGEGLLATDGHFWRSQRRLMQRDFRAPNIDSFFDTMVHEAQRTAQRWTTAAREDDCIDVTREMTRLTLRIVVRALFSLDLSDDIATPFCEAITDTIHDLGKISWTVFGVPLQFTPERNAEFRSSRKTIDDICHQMIAERRAMKERPCDLLTLLIESETEDGPLDDEQLRDEMVTMLVGGHETTALALTWAWKLLTEHPAVEKRLHDEVDHLLGSRPPRFGQMADLTWTRAVFQEAMRLYPPVWYMARVAIEDGVIDGHHIPAGACVLVSAWFTHRHPKFWSNPEEFNPSRFLTDAPADHRYAFFPFGGGRHQCLGMHFAQLEGMVLLAMLSQRFSIRTTGDNVVPNPGITLRQRPNLRAHVAIRDAAPQNRLPRSDRQ